jgi:hypothetical protein
MVIPCCNPRVAGHDNKQQVEGVGGGLCFHLVRGGRSEMEHTTSAARCAPRFIPSKTMVTSFVPWNEMERWNESGRKTVRIDHINYFLHLIHFHLPPHGWFIMISPTLSNYPD